MTRAEGGTPRTRRSRSLLTAPTTARRAPASRRRCPPSPVQPPRLPRAAAALLRERGAGGWGRVGGGGRLGERGGGDRKAARGANRCRMSSTQYVFLRPSPPAQPPRPVAACLCRIRTPRPPHPARRRATARIRRGLTTMSKVEGPQILRADGRERADARPSAHEAEHVRLQSPEVSPSGRQRPAMPSRASRPLARCPASQSHARHHPAARGCPRTASHTAPGGQRRASVWMAYATPSTAPPRAALAMWRRSSRGTSPRAAARSVRAVQYARQGWSPTWFHSM